MDIDIIVAVVAIAALALSVGGLVGVWILLDHVLKIYKTLSKIERAILRAGD